jgi:hypothetical protein
VSGWWDKVVWFVGTWVLIKNEPVFHRRRPGGLISYGDSRVTLTDCGIILDEYRDGRVIRTSTASLTSNAWTVGRPCKRCFPEPVEEPGL